MQQHPPCSVITATGDEAANSAMYSLVRDAIMLNQPRTNNNKPTKPEHGLSFRSPLHLHLSVARLATNNKHDKAFQLARRQVQRPTDAMNINSVECIRLQVLGSTGLAVEHAQWKKDLARYIGLRFHAASKVLVDARELAKAKRYEL